MVLIRVRTNIGLLRAQISVANPTVFDLKCALQAQCNMIPPHQQIILKGDIILSDDSTLDSLHIARDEIFSLGVRIEKVVCDKSIIQDDGTLLLAGTTILRLLPNHSEPTNATISVPSTSLPPALAVDEPNSLPSLLLAEDCPPPPPTNTHLQSSTVDDDSPYIRPVIPTKVMRLLSESPVYSGHAGTPLTPQVDESLRSMLRDAGMAEEDIRNALKLDQTRSRSNPSTNYTNRRTALIHDTDTDVPISLRQGSIAEVARRRRADSWSDFDSLRGPVKQQTTSPVTPSVDEVLAAMLHEAGLSEREIKEAARTQKQFNSSASEMARIDDARTRIQPRVGYDDSNDSNGMNVDEDLAVALALSISESQYTMRNN